MLEPESPPQIPFYKKEHGDYAYYPFEGGHLQFMSPDIAVAYTTENDGTVVMHKHGRPELVDAWIKDMRDRNAENIFGPILKIESSAWEVEELNRVINNTGYLGVMLKRMNEKTHPSGKRCYTGGAEGADYVWGKFSEKHGWEPQVLSFYGHNIYPDTVGSILRLSPKYLQVADVYLEKANRVLKRRFPTSKENLNNLLRRNYWQVCDTNQVIAVGFLHKDQKIVDGGTGWAVQMAIDMNKPVYVFDQNTVQWFCWNNWVGIFEGCHTPTLEDRFTGIGTRKITKEGISAIKDVFTLTREAHDKTGI